MTTWLRGFVRRAAASCVFVAVGIFAAAAAGADIDAEDEFDESEVNDPFETLNRGVFWFNEFTDIYFIEYVAVGYDFLIPDPLQRGIRNVFENLRLPIKFTNNLLQLKFKSAAEEIVRFGLNTTVGMGGLFDAATQGGLPSNNEDFGQTLGYWGAPAGPFIMLPFLGPSGVRDGFGLAVDTVSQAYSFYLPAVVNAGLTVGNLANVRVLAIDVIRDNRESAFDLYVFTRNAYVANRRYRVLDRDLLERSGTPGGTDDDLYRFDEDDEEEEDLYFFEDEE
jgi:phospholipid-binding lipoprotein MlaA